MGMTTERRGERRGADRRQSDQGYDGKDWRRGDRRDGGPDQRPPAG